MSTTIDINDAILVEVREYTNTRGLSLQAAAEEILNLGLAQREKVDKNRKYEVKPHRLGLKPGMRGVSLNLQLLKSCFSCSLTTVS